MPSNKIIQCPDGAVLRQDYTLPAKQRLNPKGFSIVTAVAIVIESQAYYITYYAFLVLDHGFWINIHECVMYNQKPRWSTMYSILMRLRRMDEENDLYIQEIREALQWLSYYLDVRRKSEEAEK